MSVVSRVIGLSALLCLTATSAFAVDEQLLAEIKNLDPYYVNESADLGKYDKVLIDSLKVGYAKVVAPPWYEGEDKGVRKWQLTDKDIKFLRDAYRDAMTSALEDDDGYPVVETGGEDVIVLDIEIITLMPYARKGEKVETRGFGELRAQATLRDGATGELLAIFEGLQDVGSEYQPNSRLNAENNLRDLFDVWGMRMRKVMDASRN